jgi:hypothetical protein
MRTSRSEVDSDIFLQIQLVGGLGFGAFKECRLSCFFI